MTEQADARTQTQASTVEPPTNPGDDSTTAVTPTTGQEGGTPAIVPVVELARNPDSESMAATLIFDAAHDGWKYGANLGVQNVINAYTAQEQQSRKVPGASYDRETGEYAWINSEGSHKGTATAADSHQALRALAKSKDPHVTQDMKDSAAKAALPIEQKLKQWEAEVNKQRLGVLGRALGIKPESMDQLTVLYDKYKNSETGKLEDFLKEVKKLQTEKVNPEGRKAALDSLYNDLMGVDSGIPVGTTEQQALVNILQEMGVTKTELDEAADDPQKRKTLAERLGKHKEGLFDLLLKFLMVSFTVAESTIESAEKSTAGS